MNNYLFIFSISPVQSFISQARKTKDLYAGSYLLSKFSRKQIKFLCNQNNVEIIFPNNINSESLPNRFLAKIIAESDSKISEMGKKLRENFKKILENEFDNLAKKLNITSDYKIYLDQLMNTFESYWAAIKLEDNYKDAYLKLEKVHAAAKNIKKFEQTMEQGRKCSLCGERNAYFYGNYKHPAFMDKALSFRINKENVFIKNEALCTTCAIKRFTNISFPSVSEIALKGIIRNVSEEIKNLYHNAELFYEENLTSKFLDKNGISIENLQNIKNIRNEILKKHNLKPSKLPKYYATIMFDGDNMGKLLAGKFLKDENDLEKFHKELSKSLSKNAEKAGDIVDKYGKTVYTGGDDFLGFVPLKNLMIVLKELRETFKRCINDKLRDMLNGNEITMSAGIVISHYKMPLKVVLDQARNMEKLAKDSGRDSFAIAVLKHSGEIHKTYWKWYGPNKSNIDNIEKIIEKIKNKKFSTNFIHTLGSEFLKLYNKESKNQKNLDLIFKSELKRLIRKSALIKDKQLKNNEIKELYELCQKMYYEGNFKIFNYLELLRIIDFISRHTGGEK